MNRKEELLNAFGNIDESLKNIIIKLVDDMVFLEDQLDALRKLPLIKIHPENPDLQKPTTAAKMYKEYLQQYNNIVKTLSSVLNKSEIAEDSPLREYLKKAGI